MPGLNYLLQFRFFNIFINLNENVVRNKVSVFQTCIWLCSRVSGRNVPPAWLLDGAYSFERRQSEDRRWPQALFTQPWKQHHCPRRSAAPETATKSDSANDTWPWDTAPLGRSVAHLCHFKTPPPTITASTSAASHWRTCTTLTHITVNPRRSPV